MKFNTIEGVEDVTIFLGVAVSLAQIQTIFGIILLSFQIIMIIYKGIVAIRNHIKNKDVNGAVKTFEDTTKQLEEKVNQINDVVDKHKKDADK